MTVRLGLFKKAFDTSHVARIMSPDGGVNSSGNGAEVADLYLKSLTFSEDPRA